MWQAFVCQDLAGQVLGCWRKIELDLVSEGFVVQDLGVQLSEQESGLLVSRDQQGEPSRSLEHGGGAIGLPGAGVGGGCLPGS